MTGMPAAARWFEKPCDLPWNCVGIVCVEGEIPPYLFKVQKKPNIVERAQVSMYKRAMSTTALGGHTGGLFRPHTGLWTKQPTSVLESHILVEEEEEGEGEGETELSRTH